MLILAQLVNRIGKKLEQIGRMDIFQMTDVLTRAEWGRFIRWHALATLQDGLISSTYRNTCQDVSSVVIHFQVSCSSRHWQYLIVNVSGT